MPVTINEFEVVDQPAAPAPPPSAPPQADVREQVEQHMRLQAERHLRIKAE